MKRVLSLTLVVLMLFTVLSFAVSAAEVTDKGVILYSSPVVRVAESSGSMAKGSKIVKATPSGVPEISGSFTAEAYAGETPVSAQVIFKSEAEAESVKIICSNNRSVVFSLTNPDKNTYVWSITDGTADAGTFLDFEVSYTIDSVEYSAYTSSYVEGIIQPAGVVINARRSSPFASEGLLIHAGYATRILGKNTYGSYYDPGDGSAGKGDRYNKNEVVWSHGYYDFVSGEEKMWGTTADAAEGYGTVLWSSELNDGNQYCNKALDKQRPVSTTYIDATESVALNSESVNLRYAAADTLYNFKESDYIRSLYSETRVLPGQAVWDKTTVNDPEASAQLGFSAMDTEVFFRQQYTLPETPYRVGTYGISVPFNGTSYTDAMTTLTDGTKEAYYTFITAFYSKQTRDAIFKTHSAINLHFVMYDKSELKALVNDAVSNYVADKNEYSSGWWNFKSALTNAQRILAKPNLKQIDIDRAVDSLNIAISGLKKTDNLSDSTVSSNPVKDFLQKIFDWILDLILNFLSKN